MWFDISSLRLSLVLGALLVVPSILSGIPPNLSHPLSMGSVAFLVLGLVDQAGAEAGGALLVPESGTRRCQRILE